MELLDKLKPLGLLGLRAGLAMIFIYHGFPKLTHTHQYVRDFAQYGFPAYFVRRRTAIRWLFHAGRGSAPSRRNGGSPSPRSPTRRRPISAAQIPTPADPGRRILRRGHHRRRHAVPGLRNLRQERQFLPPLQIRRLAVAVAVGVLVAFVAQLHTLIVGTQLLRFPPRNHNHQPAAFVA